MAFAGGGKELRDDDAGLFALEFLGPGELAAQEFDELAGARAAVGAENAHAKEEDQELKDLGILGRVDGRGGGLLFDLGEEGGEGVVEFALNGGSRRLLVDNAGSEGFVGFDESAESGKDVGICSGGLICGEFGDGESDGREKLAMHLDGVGSNAHLEERGVGGESAGVLLLVAMRGDEVAAVGGAVDGDFALGAAADGADFFRFGGAETARLAFVADRTEHERSPSEQKSV